MADSHLEIDDIATNAALGSAPPGRKVMFFQISRTSANAWEVQQRPCGGDVCFQQWDPEQPHEVLL